MSKRIYVVYDSEASTILHTGDEQPIDYVHYYRTTFYSHELIVYDTYKESKFLEHLLETINKFLSSEIYRVVDFEINYDSFADELYIPFYRTNELCISCILNYNRELLKDQVAFEFFRRDNRKDIIFCDISGFLSELHSEDILYKFSQEYLIKEFLLNSMLTVVGV